MTSAIVHDLRNPLSAILSLSRSALEDARAAGGPPELTADLAAVVMSSQRLRAMLEELLAFARQGGATPRDEEVDVPALVAESLAPHEAALRSAGVALVLDVAGAQGARVLADREALRRVLENLVRNAAEAIGLRPGPPPAGAGGPRGTVRVAAAAAEAEVAIRVEDDGCGIPEAVRATLFQPFATAGKPHGTGLGLMLARQVARNHGGDLTAEPPPPGGGAAFRLTLPRRRAG
jgi:signal transduction histidine kinase